VPLLALMSSAVTTLKTPGIFSASEKSIFFTRAWRVSGQTGTAKRVSSGSLIAASSP